MPEHTSGRSDECAVCEMSSLVTELPLRRWHFFRSNENNLLHSAAQVFFPIESTGLALVWSLHASSSLGDVIEGSHESRGHEGAVS